LEHFSLTYYLLISFLLKIISIESPESIESQLTLKKQHSRVKGASGKRLYTRGKLPGYRKDDVMLYRQSMDEEQG
jgi:hypothetical protein